MRGCVPQLLNNFLRSFQVYLLQYSINFLFRPTYDTNLRVLRHEKGQSVWRVGNDLEACACISRDSCGPGCMGSRKEPSAPLPAEYDMLALVHTMWICPVVMECQVVQQWGDGAPRVRRCMNRWVLRLIPTSRRQGESR